MFEKEKQTAKQMKERQVIRETNKYIDRDTDRQRVRETERQIDRKTDRQKDRHTERQKDRKTERQTDRKTDRQTDRKRYSQQIDKRQTFRHAGRHADITKRSNKIGKYKKQEKVESYKNECQMVEIDNKESRKTKYCDRKINIKAKIEN